MMEEKMSRCGISPIFTSLSIGYGLVTMLVSRYFHPFFQLSFAPNWILVALGVTIMVIGFPFFIVAVITVMRTYNAGALVTGGVFGCFRHPLYASWLVFIVPGTVFLANSSIALTTPIAMYILLRVLVKKEEAYLEGYLVLNILNTRIRCPVFCLLVG